MNVHIIGYREKIWLKPKAQTSDYEQNSAFFNTKFLCKFLLLSKMYVINTYLSGI